MLYKEKVVFREADDIEMNVKQSVQDAYPIPYMVRPVSNLLESKLVITRSQSHVLLCYWPLRDYVVEERSSAIVVQTKESPPEITLSEKREY